MNNALMNETRFDPTRRPGLAYQHAFDWLAVRLQDTDGPIACRAGSLFDGMELLRRSPEIPFLHPIPAGLEEQGLALGINGIEKISTEDGLLTAVAWLQPSAEALGELDNLSQKLSPSGKLYLLVSGRLARFLAERRLNVDDSRTYAGERQTILQLKKAGFHLEESIGWHGLSAVAWHYLGQIAGRVGRSDWQDRCHFAMRRAFIEQGSPLWPVALSGLVAERETLKS